MTGIEASTSPPALPRWFGPRASPDDPAVSALIDRVARGAGWADICGVVDLETRMTDAPADSPRVDPPPVAPLHHWGRAGPRARQPTGREPASPSALASGAG